MTEIIDRRSATWIAWKHAARYRVRRTLEALFSLLKILGFIAMSSATAIAAAYGAIITIQWLAE